MLTIAELANFSTYAVFRGFCLVCQTLDSKAVCVELVASKPQSQTLAPECYVMVNHVNGITKFQRVNCTELCKSYLQYIFYSYSPGTYI